MSKLKIMFAAALIAVMSTQLHAQDTDKMIRKMWKMIKTEVNGTEVKPKHDHLVIVFNKKGEFIETAKFEETHVGEWKLNDDKSKIIITDKTMEGKVTELEIVDIDDNHLALKNFDGEPSKTVYFIPLPKKKAVTLTNKEFLLCKEWTIDKSDKPETVGMKFVFNYNKTFVILNQGSHVPLSSGKWEMTKDHKTLYMDMKEEGQKLELDIEKLHRHELILKSKDGGTKHFVDHRLTSTSTASTTEDAGEAEEEAAE